MTRHPSSYHCATTAMLKTHITHDFKPRHYILYVYFIIFIVEWKCVTAWSGVWASNSSQLYLYLILSLKLKCCHSNFSFKHDQMNMTFRETKETLEYPFMNTLQDCVLDRKCKMFWPIKLAIIPSYMVMLSWLLSRHCHWRLGAAISHNGPPRLPSPRQSVKRRAPQFCYLYCDTLQYLEKATCLNALLGCSSTKCGNASARYAPSLNMV